MKKTKEKKIIICLSLPKTGTTYLSGLLEKTKFCSVSDIKEPTFFGGKEFEVGNLMKKVVANGNHEKGIEWYKKTFDLSGEVNVLADMSTQYWMHSERVIEQALKAGAGYPCFINIRREAESQMTSYIAHLRRGYIPPKSLSSLFKLDPSFYQYLLKMSKWNNDFSDLKRKYPEVNFIDIDFGELINKPLLTLSQIFLSLGVEEKVDPALDFDVVDRNKMSSPIVEWVNNLFFSDPVRRFGRKMPPSLYAVCINLRKSIVRINLKEGKNKFFHEDKLFIKKMLSEL